MSARQLARQMEKLGLIQKAQLDYRMQRGRDRINAEVIPYVFGGPYSLTDLADMGHPYGLKGGTIAFGRNTFGGDLAIIQQGGMGSPRDHTGELRKATHVKVRRTPNRIQINVVVDSSQSQIADWLTDGTRRMQARPFIARIKQRSRIVLDQELSVLLRSSRGSSVKS